MEHHPRFPVGIRAGGDIAGNFAALDDRGDPGASRIVITRVRTIELLRADEFDGEVGGEDTDIDGAEIVGREGVFVLEVSIAAVRQRVCRGRCLPTHIAIRQSDRRARSHRRHHIHIIVPTEPELPSGPRPVKPHAADGISPAGVRALRCGSRRGSDGDRSRRIGVVCLEHRMAFRPPPILLNVQIVVGLIYVTLGVI